MAIVKRRNYTSRRVVGVNHWVGKPVEWPGTPVDLSTSDAFDKCLAALLTCYDVAIRHTVEGDLILFVDDIGGGFRTR
jgi:hypothetical protein